MPIDKSCFNEAQSYAFISYSHEDSGHIVNLVEEMISRKYNIWIDKLIPPIAEWDKEISLHIQGANVAICFITESYLRSNACVKEIKYALAKQIPVLAVLFPDITLPPGLDMNLVDTQYIVVHKNDSTETLLNQICSCEHMDKCKLQIPPPSPTEPVVNSNSETIKRIKILGITFLTFIILVNVIIVLCDSDMRRDLFSYLKQHTPVSTRGKDYQSLSDIEPFNGELIWNTGIAEDPHGNQYSGCLNYATFNNDEKIFFHEVISVDYYLAGEYEVMTGYVVPHCTAHMNSNATVSIYGDYGMDEQILLYSADTINKKSDSKEIRVDLTGVKYLTITINIAPKAAIILYDLRLWS